MVGATGIVASIDRTGRIDQQQRGDKQLNASRERTDIIDAQRRSENDENA